MTRNAVEIVLAALVAAFATPADAAYRLCASGCSGADSCVDHPTLEACQAAFQRVSRACASTSWNCQSVEEQRSAAPPPPSPLSTGLQNIAEALFEECKEECPAPQIDFSNPAAGGLAMGRYNLCIQKCQELAQEEAAERARRQQQERRAQALRACQTVGEWPTRGDSGVSIRYAALWSEENWCYGTSLTVVNRGGRPQLLTIRMTSGRQSQLDSPVRIDPGYERKLGWVMPADAGVNWALSEIVAQAPPPAPKPKPKAKPEPRPRPPEPDKAPVASLPPKEPDRPVSPPKPKPKKKRSRLDEIIERHAKLEARYGKGNAAGSPRRAKKSARDRGDAREQGDPSASRPQDQTAALGAGFGVGLDAREDTLLVSAARRCDDKAIRMAIERADAVDERGQNGETALIAAAKGKCPPSIAGLLLDHNADANARDDEGRTALDHAQSRKDKKTAGLLRKRGGLNGSQQDAREVARGAARAAGRMTKLADQTGKEFVGTTPNVSKEVQEKVESIRAELAAKPDGLKAKSLADEARAQGETMLKAGDTDNAREMLSAAWGAYRYCAERLNKLFGKHKSEGKECAKNAKAVEKAIPPRSGSADELMRALFGRLSPGSRAAGPA